MATNCCGNVQVKKRLVVYVLSNEPALLEMIRNDSKISKIVCCKLKKVVFARDITQAEMKKTDEYHQYFTFDVYSRHKKKADERNIERSAIYKRSAGNVVATLIEEPKDMQNIFIVRIKPLIIRLLNELIQSA